MNRSDYITSKSSKI